MSETWTELEEPVMIRAKTAPASRKSGSLIQIQNLPTTIRKAR